MGKLVGVIYQCLSMSTNNSVLVKIADKQSVSGNISQWEIFFCAKNRGDRTKKKPDMYPPDTYPKDKYPPVTYPLDTYLLDTYPLGHIPPGHLPPGHLPPGHLPPRTYTPQDIYPLYFKMPYFIHASCVDYILHFKKYLFCRNSICL